MEGNDQNHAAPPTDQVLAAVSISGTAAPQGQAAVISQGESGNLRKDIDDHLHHGVGGKVARFALACLSSVPVVGGAIGGAGGAWSEAEQNRFNKILASWLKLQEEEMKEIGRTLVEVMDRLDKTDPEIEKRLQSPEYLSILKKAFRDWSAAESEEKRVLIRNLLANAAACRLCSDHIVRLFVEWIDKYSEPHFMVIKVVHKNPGSTRAEMWEKIHGQEVREDSAEADLFKLLIHDLSVGHVIRQHREVDYSGQFIKPSPRRSSGSSPYLKSAFDDEKVYELTELGRQFVHYTMNEIVPKIGVGTPPDAHG